MRVKPPSAQGRAPRVSGGLASWLEKRHRRSSAMGGTPFALGNRKQMF